MLLLDKNLYTTVILLISRATYGDSNETRGFFDFLFSPCRCKCGVPNRESRLLGGEFLDPYEFPWMALVHIKGEFSVPGTIINNKYVISNARNLFGLTPFDLKVSLGVYDRCIPDTISTNVSIEKIILHPDFSPGNGGHDLALIKISSPISFERRISPICLAFPGRKYQGQVATTAAWVENESPQEGIIQSCQPRKLGLPVLSDDRCILGDMNSKNISNDLGCIGVIGAPNLICKIDSGSGVIYRSHSGIYELIGILSSKNECGIATPALFTKINEHLPWIVAETKDACYCFKT